MDTDIVSTRITNQMNRIFCVRGLQLRWVGHCDYDGYKWNETDIKSTRVISEKNLICEYEVHKSNSSHIVSTRITSEMNQTLWVRELQVNWSWCCEYEDYKWNESDFTRKSLQVNWFVKWSGHCEYGAYKRIESDITITKNTSEWKRTLWVRGSQIKWIAYFVYEGYKWDESDIVSTRVTREMKRTLRVRML